jgi:hypothetical protein
MQRITPVSTLARYAHILIHQAHDHERGLNRLPGLTISAISAHILESSMLLWKPRKRLTPMYNVQTPMDSFSRVLAVPQQVPSKSNDFNYSSNEFERQQVVEAMRTPSTRNREACTYGADRATIAITLFHASVQSTRSRSRFSKQHNIK